MPSLPVFYDDLPWNPPQSDLFPVLTDAVGGPGRGCIIRKGQSIVPPPNLDAARSMRDAMLAKVARNAGDDWQLAALASLSRFCVWNDDFTGEEFRVWSAEHGLAAPHHHNAWGSLFRIAARHNMIRITDRTRPMTTVRSHARRSPIWEPVK